MIALEVRLNGTLVTTAGREDLCVLNTIVDAIGVLGSKSAGTKTVKNAYQLKLSVGGLSAETDEDPGQHLAWYPRSPVQVGDEISIRIVETDSADRPNAEKDRQPMDLRERERRNWEIAKEHYLKYRKKYEQGDA